VILRAPVARIQTCQVLVQRSSRCFTRLIPRVHTEGRAATSDETASCAIVRSGRVGCLLTTHGHGVCRGR
jgi:hypothetical protein